MGEEKVNLAFTVANASHYNRPGTKEYIHASKESLTPEEFRGAMKWTIGKYLGRYLDKEDIFKDLAKAQWYLERLVEYEQELQKKETPDENANEITKGRGTLVNAFPPHTYPNGGFIPPSSTKFYSEYDFLRNIIVGDNSGVNPDMFKANTTSYNNANQIPLVEDKNEPEKYEENRKSELARRIIKTKDCVGIHCWECPLVHAPGCLAYEE